MSRTMYNCPNCAAPIGYHEVCAYCGTALNWVPFVRNTLQVEKTEYPEVCGGIYDRSQ